jgi:Domain of unknown function (DUF4365)
MPNQNQAQLTGRQGERWFIGQLPSSWIFQPPMEDIGIDGLVVICAPGNFNGLEFRVQIKSSRKWTVKDGSMVLRNIKSASLRYWVTGFTPTLLILYETSTDRGFCAWANQILADKTGLLSGEESEISLHVPMTSPVDEKAWERIGNEVAGLSAVLGRRISLAGSVTPFLRALHVLGMIRDDDPDDPGQDDPGR